MELNDVKKNELDKKRFKLGIESNESDAAYETVWNFNIFEHLGWQILIIFSKARFVTIDFTQTC